MFRKIIHWLIMPCSIATQEIEKQNGGYRMSFLQKQRLKAHLAICKWCSAYKRKVVFLDSELNKLNCREEIDNLEGIDKQNFKNSIKQILKK